MKGILNITSHYQKVKALYLRYERWLMPTTLVVGFLVDYFTFTSIQISVTFSLLILYWIIAGAIIVLTNLYDINKLPRRLKYVRLFSPLILQFTFGALLGSSLVFYWLSGAFSVSWPIVLIVAMLMVFNDIFRHYFLKPVLQTSLYFFITLSLFSLILPFVFKSLSPWLFIIAGIASTIIFLPYIQFLPLKEADGKKQKKQIFISILSILAVMNFLYFANVIPPIPLSLREAGLYHGLTTTNGNYILEGEPETFWDTLIPGQIVHLAPNERIYFYSAVFAPDDLRATIVHHWQFYDETKKDWISQNSFSFDIIGGRKEGYKGYSYQSNLNTGRWRIYIENQRGQVLGRAEFTVEKVTTTVPVQKTTK